MKCYLLSTLLCTVWASNSLVGVLIPRNNEEAKYISNTRISIFSKNGVEIASALARMDGSFSVPFQQDDCLVHFLNPVLRFDPLAVVSGEVFKYSVLGGLGTKQELPLRVSVREFAWPFVPEESIDFFQLFKNPMVIMGLVMLGLVYLMPKLQNSVSPEEMQQLRQDLSEDGGMAANFFKKMIPNESLANKQK